MSEPTIAESRIAELTARVDELAAALTEMQRQARRTSQRRQGRWPIAFVLLLAAVSPFASGASAHSTQLQSGRFSTPFEIFGDDGRTILRIEDVRGQPSISIGRMNTGGISLGVDRSGAGFFAVRRENGSYSSIIDATGLQVIGADGKAPAAVLGLDSGGKQPLLRLGGEKAGGIDAGADASGTGYLAVRTAKGQPGISLGQRAGRSLAVSIIDAAGSNAIAELGTDKTGGGRVEVHGADPRAVATIGTAPNYELALNFADFGSNSLAALGVRNGDGQLQVGDEKRGGFKAGLGESNNGFASVRNANGTFAITMGTYRGAQMGVTVFDDAGAQRVAVMGRASIGGGLFFANNKSGTTRGIMSGETGELHMADDNGITRATVVAAGRDAGISVRNSSGITVGLLRTSPAGNGMFQIANADGNAMVEAGLLEFGNGVVRTYPHGNPGVGLVGAPGTFIMGKIGGKN